MCVPSEGIEGSGCENLGSFSLTSQYYIIIDSFWPMNREICLSLDMDIGMLKAFNTLHSHRQSSENIIPQIPLEECSGCGPLED